MSKLDSIREWMTKGFHALADILYPPACISCHALLDKNERVFCTSCRPFYDEAKARECGTCFLPRSQCTCSTASLRKGRIRRLYKLFLYVPTVSNDPEHGYNQLIYQLKRSHLRDVTLFLANELADTLRSSPDCQNRILVHAPRSRGAIMKYGYDHTEELGRTLARLLEIPFVPAIRRRPGGVAQKTLTHAERRKNVESVFYPSRKADIRGKDVFLLDDVVTSGATMVACAKVLFEMGARSVVGICIGRAGKDEHARFLKTDS